MPDTIPNLHQWERGPKITAIGGGHRSVAITKALADFIKQKGYQATENHRDMTRA